MSRLCTLLFCVFVVSNASAFELYGNNDGYGTNASNTIAPETKAFAMRVTADGGTVIDLTAVNTAIKKAKAGGYWSSLKAAYSPLWGVKGTTTCSKLYSLTGAAYDLVQSTEVNQPILSNGFITLDSTIKWIGASFTLAQPEAVVAVVKAVSWTPSRYLWDGNALNKMALGQIGIDGLEHTDLRGYAGSWVGQDYPDIKSSYHLHTGQTSIVTAKYNGVDSYILLNDLLKTTGDIGAVSADGFTLGSNNVAQISANVSFKDIYILSTSQDTLISNVSRTLNAAHNIYGFKNQIVFEGDSLTYGSAALDPYPSQVMAALGEGWDWYNMGRPGYPISIIYGQQAARIDSLHKSQLSKNILAFWAGTNDVATLATDGGAGVYALYKLACQERKAAGWKVIAFTMLPRVDVGSNQVGFEPSRITFNALVRTDLAPYVDAIVDVAADSRLQNPLDTAYFASDMVHLNNTGAGVVAGKVIPLVQGL